MNVTILYADISDSTMMVDELSDTMAAEYYKAFLHCASQIIKSNDGVIQAYDGDRVMAVYSGQRMTDKAVKSALEIHFASVFIVNHVFDGFYGESARPLQFTIGIDEGECLAVKVGVRAAGEVAWIGAAANYAAKLNSFEGLDHDYPVRITEAVFKSLSDGYKSDSAGTPVWEGAYTNLKARRHFRSRFWSTIA
jgi:class 3 adenylate cyclase